MKPIFSKNDDINKTAYLNWRINDDNILNMLNLADGFLTAAIDLAQLAIENNRFKKADILIFPILTNVNHAIELYLKAMAWTLNNLLNENLKIDKTHDIKQLLQIVESKIKRYNGNISLNSFKNSVRNLKAYIDELFSKITVGSKKTHMDFSRYPFDSNYMNHFYVDEKENVVIDLENFILRFKAIKDELETLSDFLYHNELNQDY